MGFIWFSFVALPWWGMIAWVVYLIYFICRAVMLWQNAHEYGLARGYRETFIRDSEYLRLHHLIRMVFDIPPAVIGLLFPLIKAVFSLKIAKLKGK